MATDESGKKRRLERTRTGSAQASTPSGQETPPDTQGSPAPTGVKPVVLVVRRGRARARFRIYNKGDRRLDVSRARLEGVQFFDRQGAPLQDIAARGRIEPGQSGELSVLLNIDPQTPAGCYPAVLDLPGQPLPVTIVVPEERLVRLTPTRLAVEAQPGDVIERCIAVENLGNAPITVYSPLPAPLEIRDKLHDLLRRAVLQTPTDDYHAFLNSLVGRARELVAADLNRLLVPTLLEAPRVLAPGESAAFTLRWRVPGALDRGQRYRAALGIAGTSLVVEVLRPRTVEPPPPLELTAREPE